QSLEWSDSGVEGANRFLKRLWKLVHSHNAAGAVPALDVGALSNPQRDLRRKLHETIAKISDDYGRRLTFNTAIAAAMELSNELARIGDRSGQWLAVEREALRAMVLLLAPIVPHICHTLWRELGNDTPLIDARWPQVDSAALERSTIDLAVQINGKVRCQIEVAVDAPHDTIIAHALAQDSVQKFIAGKTIAMSKVIPGKLVTFAVK